MGGPHVIFPSMSFPEYGEPHDRRVTPQPAPVSLTLLF